MRQRSVDVLQIRLEFLVLCGADVGEEGATHGRTVHHGNIVVDIGPEEAEAVVQLPSLSLLAAARMPASKVRAITWRRSGSPTKKSARLQESAGEEQLELCGVGAGRRWHSPLMTVSRGRHSQVRPPGGIVMREAVRSRRGHGGCTG